MNEFIPVCAPVLNGNEKSYVLDCIDSTWISSNGKYIGLFESKFADFIGTKHAISCCNGTVALHLALLALGTKPGDEILVPTLTFVATANAVTYCGAKPVFIDSEEQTWNINPELIQSKITPHTRGIIVVHLYGHPADIDPILEIAKANNLFVIEDVAEAHGAEYKGRKTGLFGDISTFSFYGNKIITTGEGGMVCTQNDELAIRIRQLKGQGQDFENRYWFPVIGFNYRMTNIEAAIGLAQLENVEWHMQRRKDVANYYREQLSHVDKLKFSPEMPWAKNAFWMSSVVLDLEINRDTVMKQLYSYNIETRPFFYPMHILPIYKPDIGKNQYPVADFLSRQGINLPSSSSLERQQIKYITDVLKKVISN